MGTWWGDRLESRQGAKHEGGFCLALLRGLVLTLKTVKELVKDLKEPVKCLAYSLEHSRRSVGDHCH